MEMLFLAKADNVEGKAGEGKKKPFWSLEITNLDYNLNETRPVTPEIKYSDFMELFFTKEMIGQKEGVIQKLTMEKSKLLQKVIF